MAASVGKELGREDGGPAGRALGLLHVRADPAIPRQRPQREDQVADDGRQEIVEVVRDAAGEIADRIHLLRLQQLQLEAPPLGHVLDDTDELVSRPGRSGLQASPQ